MMSDRTFYRFTFLEVTFDWRLGKTFYVALGKMKDILISLSFVDASLCFARKS
mgnify:CR=1 FL=1